MKKTFLLVAGLLALVACSQDGSDASLLASGNGQAGSLARFALNGDKLYVVTNNSLIPFDVAQPDNPVRGIEINLGFGIETVFPYNNRLYVGSQDAMYTYSLTNSLQPQLLSRYSHIVSCDPVVVQGNYAYVTLRTGTTCRGAVQNIMDVVNISNPASPFLVRTISMQNPHGLGVDGNLLFVTEGEFGLKLFDISNPADPVLTRTLPDIRSFDVIPHQNVLLVIGTDGLYQYSYADPNNLTQLSRIPTGS